MLDACEARRRRSTHVPLAPLRRTLYTEEARQRAKAADVHAAARAAPLRARRARVRRRAPTAARSRSWCRARAAREAEANKICMEYLVWRTEADASDGGGGGGGGAAAGLTTRVRGQPGARGVGEREDGAQRQLERHWSNLRFDAKSRGGGRRGAHLPARESRVTRRGGGPIVPRLLPNARRRRRRHCSARRQDGARLGAASAAVERRAAVGDARVRGCASRCLSNVSQLGLWQTCGGDPPSGQRHLRPESPDVAAVDQDAALEHAEELLRLKAGQPARRRSRPTSGAEYHLTLDAAHAGRARALLKRSTLHLRATTRQRLLGGRRRHLGGARGAPSRLLDVFGFEHGAQLVASSSDFANEKLILPPAFSRCTRARQARVDRPDNAGCAFFDCAARATIINSSRRRRTPR